MSGLIKKKRIEKGATAAKTTTTKKEDTKKWQYILQASQVSISRGAWGPIRNRKTAKNIAQKPQNRKKFCPKPKTENRNKTPH